MRILPLGVLVEDRVTKYTGRLMARTSYLTGCDRYVITPQGITQADGSVAENMACDVITLDITDDTNPLILPQVPFKYFELGVTCKSAATGFVGKITARHVTLNGTHEYLLQGENQGNGKIPPSTWCDGNVLTELDVPKLVLFGEELATPGKVAETEAVPARKVGPGPVHPSATSCYMEHPSITV